VTSIVSICNLALSNLAKENISALTEPTAEARACKQFFEFERDLMFQAYPWRFAGRTVSLAEIANDKPRAWGRAYQRPVDCLHVRWLRPAYSTVDPVRQSHHEEVLNPFEIEGETIYCNLSPAFARITARLTDPSKLPPLVVDLLAWRLAARLAMPLTRDPKIRADAMKIAEQAKIDAQEADANEVRETSDHESDFVQSRDGVV